ncbi:hypothetical protein TNCV_1873071 [Trichonephila clavipes]|nr:hypothetical protein TNCV_1873071 [Trichonephila clavipes]
MIFSRPRRERDNSLGLGLCCETSLGTIDNGLRKSERRSIFTALTVVSAQQRVHIRRSRLPSKRAEENQYLVSLSGADIGLLKRSKVSRDGIEKYQEIKGSAVSLGKGKLRGYNKPSRE